LFASSLDKESGDLGGVLSSIILLGEVNVTADNVGGEEDPVFPVKSNSGTDEEDEDSEDGGDDDELAGGS